MLLRPQTGQETVEFFRQTLVAFAPRVEGGLIGWLLLPFRWVTSPLFVLAPGANTLLKVTGAIMPLALLVVHNEWVVRSQAKSGVLA